MVSVANINLASRDALQSPDFDGVAMNTTTAPAKAAPRRKFRNLGVRDSLHFANVDQFFSNEDNFNILYGILKNTDAKNTTVATAAPDAKAADSNARFPRISLRTLEHLCTKYAHKQTATYSFHGQTFSVDREYQKFLSTYGKAKFDVFRRSPEKTYIAFTKFGKTVYTTLCQLIFFRAAIQCGMLHYAVRHQARIEEDMANRLKEQRQKRRRRRSSSPPENRSENDMDTTDAPAAAMEPFVPPTPATQMSLQLDEMTIHEPKRLRLSE